MTLDLSLSTGDSDPKAVQRGLILGRQQMSRQAEILGNTPWQIFANPAYHTARPGLSVIISLYNYQKYIGECLASLEKSDLEAIPGGIEIVVVDDSSTDNSAELVKTFLAATALPTALVGKFYNTGLAETRNLGVKLARAPYCFILDADNWLYPDCLATLYAKIQDSSYAAVYNIIVNFDDATGEKLDFRSQYEWDPVELLRNPYIDAMALFNREILLKLGGYSTELVEYGWFGFEDYDLWLKLAQADYRACLVPQVLSGYRVHLSSMLHTTNLYALRLNSYFGQKFAGLLKKYSPLDRYFGFEPQFEGYLEGVTSNYMGGWVWNRYLPSNQLELEIYDYDEKIADLTANQFRLDIFEKGYGSGSFGFLYMLPSHIKDGQKHLLRVKVAGTPFELSGSPQLFTYSSDSEVRP